MDAVTGILALVNLLLFTDKFFRGVKIVRRGQDLMSDDLYIRLIVEKARYAEWKNRMGINTIGDAQKLMGKLTIETRFSLMEILSSMQRYTEETEKYSVRYNLDSLTPPSPLNTSERLSPRINFAPDDQRKLNELLNVLKSCNDGLVQIVPPAPAYYEQGSYPIPSASDLSTRAQYSEIQTQLLSSLPSSAVNPEYTQGSSHPTRDELENRPMLQLMHSRCIHCLRTITDQFPKYTLDLGHAADQLSLWASGMFTGRITLDQVLRGNSTPKKLFGDQIIGTLVDIATYLGKLCSPSLVELYCIMNGANTDNVRGQY